MEKLASGSDAQTLLPIPWHRRLSVRLAALLLAVHAFLLFAMPVLYDLGTGLFGLPAGERTIFDGLGRRPRPAQLAAGTDFHQLAEQLMSGAVEQAPGRWLPEQQAWLQAVEQQARAGRGLAWLSAEKEVLAVSPELRGVQLGQRLEGASTIDWRSSFVPTYARAELAGWLVVLGAAAAQASPLPESSQDQNLRYLTGSLVGVGLAVIFGALASFAISRLVARRLSQLAKQVAVPFRGDGDLPGPFDDSGRDEIALLARAMNLTRERAEELIGRLGEREAAHRAWVAQVSHDLRTPLTALMVCFDRADIELRAHEGEELRERMHDLVGSMRTDAKRVNTLADDLLDVARLDMGDALILEPVPPAELVRHVVNVLRPMIDAQGLELTVDIEPSLPILNGDGRRLVRALENLLRNSLQHARRSVSIGARRSADHVCFVVRDDGPGFPTVEGQVDLRQLSGRRGRVDSAGLGLVVARKVTAAHKGKIEARNLPGGGSEATIEIAIPEPQLGEDESSHDLRI